MAHNYDICVDCNLKVDDGSANAFASVNGVVSIDFPDGILAKVKASYMGQADRVIKYQAGMEDAGEVSVECLLDTTELSRIHGLKGISHSWKVFAPTGISPALVGTFTGFVSDVPIKFNLEDLAMFSFKIVRTTAISFSTT